MEWCAKQISMIEHTTASRGDLTKLVWFWNRILHHMYPGHVFLQNSCTDSTWDRGSGETDWAIWAEVDIRVREIRKDTIFGPSRDRKVQLIRSSIENYTYSVKGFGIRMVISQISLPDQNIWNLLPPVAPSVSPEQEEYFIKKVW